MCNGAYHKSGCECGFGPPYPGTISQVGSVDWTESAAHSREVFKKTLEELNLDADTIRKFNREYRDVQASSESSKLGKLRSLISRLQFKDEDTKIVPINVPLFRLHSPSVKGAKVIYREIGETRKIQRGWFVTVFGQGTGPTNTYKVIYDTPFESVNGECRRVYVPLQLEVKSVAAYESGDLVGRGVRLAVKGLEDEHVLRKRGCELLEEKQCSDDLVGPISTLNYNRKKESTPHTEPFTQLWGTHVRDSIELETIKVFNTTITPIAELEHHHQLDLEFKLPGKRNYILRYNNSGLQWAIS
jgi:hypothetical protein